MNKEQIQNYLKRLSNAKLTEELDEEEYDELLGDVELDDLVGIKMAIEKCPEDKIEDFVDALREDVFLDKSRIIRLWGQISELTENENQIVELMKKDLINHVF